MLRRSLLAAILAVLVLGAGLASRRASEAPAPPTRPTAVRPASEAPTPAERALAERALRQPHGAWTGPGAAPLRPVPASPAR